MVPCPPAGPPGVDVGIFWGGVGHWRFTKKWTVVSKLCKFTELEGHGDAMMVRLSRCACGACQIEVKGEPASSGLCSCDNCKRRTGAPFGWSIYFRDEQVGTVEGPLATLVGRDTRWFCSKCGSTLYWKSSGAWKPGQTGFAGGCFADLKLPAPTIAVRCAQGMPWVTYPAACALFDDMPPRIEPPIPTRSA